MAFTWLKLYALAGLCWLLHLHQAGAFKICLVQNPGFANCTPGAPPSTYSGIDVDLIRAVAANISWAEVPDGQPDAGFNLSTRTFSFVCTERRIPEVMDILTNSSQEAEDECAMGAGAWTVTRERLSSGLRFSWPHMRTGVAVLVGRNAQAPKYDKWAFLRPFSPDVWIALMSSTAFVPLLLFVVENILQTGQLPVGMSMLTEWRHATYTMFLCCFNLGLLEVLSLPSQLIIISFAFTNLILVASYTANLAAVLFNNDWRFGVNSIEELEAQGLPIAAHGTYVDRLRDALDISAEREEFLGVETFTKVQKRLEAGTLGGYVMDRPILEYWSSLYNPDCTVGIISTTILPFDYGIAFHRNMPSDMLLEFNRGVVELQSTIFFLDVEAKYLSTERVDACNEPPSDGEVSLMFGQIAGLWIVMGVAMGLGVLTLLVNIISRVCGRIRARKRALEGLKDNASYDEMEEEGEEEEDSDYEEEDEFHMSSDHNILSTYRGVEEAPDIEHGLTGGAATPLAMSTQDTEVLEAAWEAGGGALDTNAQGAQAQDASHNTSPSASECTTPPDSSLMQTGGALGSVLSRITDPLELAVAKAFEEEDRAEAQRAREAAEIAKAAAAEWRADHSPPSRADSGVSGGLSPKGSFRGNNKEDDGPSGNSGQRSAAAAGGADNKSKHKGAQRRPTFTEALKGFTQDLASIAKEVANEVIVIERAPGHPKPSMDVSKSEASRMELTGRVSSKAAMRRNPSDVGQEGGRGLNTRPSGGLGEEDPSGSGGRHAPLKRGPSRLGQGAIRRDTSRNNLEGMAGASQGGLGTEAGGPSMRRPPQRGPSDVASMRAALETGEFDVAEVLQHAREPHSDGWGGAQAGRPYGQASSSLEKAQAGARAILTHASTTISSASASSQQGMMSSAGDATSMFRATTSLLEDELCASHSQLVPSQAGSQPPSGSLNSGHHPSPPNSSRQMASGSKPPSSGNNAAASAANSLLPQPTGPMWQTSGPTSGQSGIGAGGVTATATTVTASNTSSSPREISSSLSPASWQGLASMELSVPKSEARSSHEDPHQHLLLHGVATSLAVQACTTPLAARMAHAMVPAAADTAFVRWQHEKGDGSRADAASEGHSQPLVLSLNQMQETVDAGCGSDDLHCIDSTDKKLEELELNPAAQMGPGSGSAR